MGGVKWLLVLTLVAVVVYSVWFSGLYELPTARIVFFETPSRQYTFDTFPADFVKYEIPDDAGGDAGVEVVDGKLKIWVRSGSDICVGSESEATVALDFEVGKLYKIVTASAYLPDLDYRFYKVALDPRDKNDLLFSNLASDRRARRDTACSRSATVLHMGSPRTGGCISGYCTPPEEIYLFVSPLGNVYAWDGNGVSLPVVTARLNPYRVKTLLISVENSSCHGDVRYMDWQIDEISVYDIDFGVFAYVNVRNLAEAGLPSRLFVEGVDARGAGSYDINVYVDGSLYVSTTVSGFPAEIPIEFSAPGSYEVNVVAVRGTDGMLSYYVVHVNVVSGRSAGYNKAFVVELNVPSDLNDYTVLLRLDTNQWIQNGWVDPDLNGVRFYDKFGTLLPAWVIPETKGTDDTWIYVKVPSLSAPVDSIYVYLGDYQPYWEGRGALDAFDDFDDGSVRGFALFSGWDGSWAVSDGLLNIRQSESYWSSVEVFGKYIVFDQIDFVFRLRALTDKHWYTLYCGWKGFSSDAEPFFANISMSETDLHYPFIGSVLEENAMSVDNTQWHVYVYRPFETNVLSALYSLHPDRFELTANAYDAMLEHSEYYNYDYPSTPHVLFIYGTIRNDVDIDYMGYRRYVWSADPAVLSISEPTFPTETSVSVSSPTVDVNEVFQATICVSSGGTSLGGAPVQLLVSTDGESYQIYGEGVTGADGCEVFDVSFAYPGSYYLKGRTATFENYLGSESDYVVIHVVSEEPDLNEALCVSLGYYWAGDHCCGDDAGEYTPDTCDGVFDPAGCTCSPRGGGGGVTLRPSPEAEVTLPADVIYEEQPEVSVQQASPLQAVPSWAWLVAFVVVAYMLYAFTRKR